MAVEVRPDALRRSMALWSARKASTIACGSARSSVVTAISTRLQVERITPSDTPSRDFQIGQRRRQRFLAEGQALAHLDGRCFVTHACDQQLHCFRSSFPSRACATQVSAEKPDHRHGHDRGFAAAPSGGDAQEHHGQIDAPGEERDGDFRLADPVGLQFDEGPGAAGDHGQRDQHEAERHGFGDQFVQRAERRQAVVELARFLGL